MEAQRVPEGMAEMPPGPELAAVLAGLDVDAVANGDTVAVMQAWSRQLAHDQARFLAALVQVGRSTPFSGSLERPVSVGESAQRLLAAGQWAAGEVAAALRWTHHRAECEHAFAEQLVCDLPVVFAALDGGGIDRAKAWVFADVLGTGELTEAQVTRICAVLVPCAPGLTTGQLRARLLRMVLEIDPGYTARRYRAAVRERGVFGYLAPDGTATISGQGLPVEEAVAACERIEGLADAARRAGHPGSVHQIRADLYTRLLDGRFHGMSSTEMIAALLADAAGPSAGPVAAADFDRSGAGSPDEQTATSDAGTSPGAPADDDAASAHSADSSTSDAPSATSSDDEENPATVEPNAGARPDATGVRADDLVGVERQGWGGEIRVGLMTLLGRDERPGEVPGWGPVPAGVARAMVARQHRGQWRFAVTDPEGYLLLGGVTRRRPTATDPEARECRGGVVEIHVPATLLAELAADPASCREWAGVVADIAGQYAQRDRHDEVLASRPDDRFAHAALRRHIQIRDRRCMAPGCRRPARHCEQDHTIDHALGGRTVSGNVGPLCTRHHRMKHEAGWRLEQPWPGVFRWTSPLGQVHDSRGEPISPPDPGARPRHPKPDDESTPPCLERPILHRPAPDPPPPPRPDRPPDDDIPPF